MQTVKRESLIAQVTGQLRAEISAGRWSVGERIPTEPELQELTGTSRNTVREAVQALVHAGLLERRQGSGTYVTATDESRVAFGDFFAAARRRDLLELREGLEVTAAGLAARRRTRDDITALRTLLADTRRSWAAHRDGDGAAMDAAVAADTQLHRAIVAASHNEIYLEFYDLLLPALREAIADHQHRVADSYEDMHAVLVDSVVDGDEAAARAAARALLVRVSQS